MLSSPDVSVWMRKRQSVKKTEFLCACVCVCALNLFSLLMFAFGEYTWESRSVCRQGLKSSLLHLCESNYL